MYEIRLASQAERDLKKLPAQVFPRVASVIRDLTSDPRPQGCRKLQASADPTYRLRVGPHRILYEIDDAARQIKILRVRHRREAYR